MNFPGGFDWLDIVLCVGIIIGLVVGYEQGLLRQTIGLAVLYVGTILGAQYFSVVAGAIRYVFGSAPSRFVNAIGFFTVLLAVSAAISWLVYDAYHVTRLKWFPLLDRIGGSLLGFLTAVIIVSLLLPVVTFAAGETWPWGEETRFLIVSGMQSSRLVPVFELFKPGLLDVLGLWLPGGLPSIFNL